MSYASTYAADSFNQSLPTPSKSPSPFDTLPDELVDSICRHATDLPTFSASASASASSSESGEESKSSWYCEPSSRYLMEMRFPPPMTVLTLRLVSRRLSRIATPYMWETLDVQLRRPHQYQYQHQHQLGNDDDNNDCDHRRLSPTKPRRSGPGSGSGSQQQRKGRTRLRSRNSIDVLEYVAARPLLAGMVRVLCLRVVGYEFASVASSESGDDSAGSKYDYLDGMRDLQRRIERLLIETKSLTAFCIDKADLLTPLAASTLLSCRTLRLVDLRTVAFQGEGVRMLVEGEKAPQPIGVLEYFGLSVFNLGYRNGEGLGLMVPRGVRKVSLHCDSMSAFVGDEEDEDEDEEDEDEDEDVLEEQLNVGTIEELAIYDKHGDVAFYVSKHFLNARKQGRLVALKELFLDLEWCQMTRLSKILSNFQTPTLEKLTIRNLHRMAPSGLCEIAEWFPNVRELALSSRATDIVPAWIIGRFHEYVEAFRGLNSLESLEWDNSAVCYFIKEAEGESGLGASLTVLAKLGKLRSVRMISFSSRSVSMCRILRKDADERGEYAGYLVDEKGVFTDFEASRRLIGALYK